MLLMEHALWTRKGLQVQVKQPPPPTHTHCLGCTGQMETEPRQQKDAVRLLRAGMLKLVALHGCRQVT